MIERIEAMVATPCRPDGTVDPGYLNHDLARAQRECGAKLVDLLATIPGQAVSVRYHEEREPDPILAKIRCIIEVYDANNA